MTNALAVCLLFCCTGLALARQIPEECAKGPEYWCKNLRNAADCGAAGHCIGTVWATKDEEISRNDVSDKFVKLFSELKDVKDLINEEYLGSRVSSACRDLPVPAASAICRANTAHLEQYLYHALSSDVTPQTLCRVVDMCNNMKLDNVIALNKKKAGGSVKKSDDSFNSKKVILGGERCTWGPSYWCSNITTGHECKATHHCITRVWSKMQLPEDNDSICKICTDMVKEARDQLQSNETQEELKQVFEGSCKLIPIKIISEECIKMADEFIPELVETLASQMNPQMVCSVAGLCNNARIDALLEEYNEELKKREGCTNCNRAVGALRRKFDATSYDDFLVNLLQVCRDVGSLSDSCSMLVFKYYENIIEALKKDLTPGSVCHLSGQCVHRFHQHDQFTFPEDSTDLTVQDDVPCEFCEQLVVHLRDVIVANTTEVQFYRVLTGLCKQTGNFKAECLHLAEEYYPVIYNYLVSGLKPKEICALIGVCGKSVDTLVAPLLPSELAVKVLVPRTQLIGADDAKIDRYVIPKQSNVRVLGPAPSEEPLPIERMFVSFPQTQNKAVCSFCQYFLHYLQVELSDTNTEDKIKSAVEKACERLPESVNGECKQFVSEYGPAVIALLVQEIDPASVCPALGLCPTVHEVRKVSVNSEKTNCPLCLFAVEQLEAMLKTNRTEASIRTALENLCNHLSTKLRTECTDFVDQYANQLVEMLVANMNAQEVCVYLKLCSDNIAAADPLKVSQSPIDKFHDKPQLMADRNRMRKPMLPNHMLEIGTGDIETNEIPDNTVNGRPVKPQVSQKSGCVICEFVMSEIEDQIKDKHNEDEFKKIVHGVCKRMPKTVRASCDEFVERYADLVISILTQGLDPLHVCQELKLCDRTNHLEKVKEEILDCAVCETVVMAVKKVLNNDKVDRNIVHIVEKSCGMLPAKYNARCHTLMEIYGDSVIHLIEDFGSKQVCQKIGICVPQTSTYINMYKEKNH